MPNNVWTNSSQGSRQASGIQPNAAAQAPAAPAFNAQEVRDLLKNAYKSGTPCLPYHPGPEAAHNTRRPAKLSNMANNKDFLLELHHQVLAMRQSGERAGG